MSTINATLATPLTVAQNGSPVGIRMDFDLAKSIQVSGGQITGSVTPTFNIGAVGPSDSGAYIDAEFDAGKVSGKTRRRSPSRFRGRTAATLTVNVNGNTEWDNNNESLSLLSTSSIVSISGMHGLRR